MDNEHIILVLDDINKMQDEIQNAWNELLHFIDRFSHDVSQEKLKLPYHLNYISTKMVIAVSYTNCYCTSM